MKSYAACLPLPLAYTAHRDSWRGLIGVMQTWHDDGLIPSYKLSVDPWFSYEDSMFITDCLRRLKDVPVARAKSLIPFDNDGKSLQRDLYERGITLVGGGLEKFWDMGFVHCWMVLGDESKPRQRTLGCLGMGMPILALLDSFQESGDRRLIDNVKAGSPCEYRHC